MAKVTGSKYYTPGWALPPRDPFAEFRKPKGGPTSEIEKPKGFTPPPTIKALEAPGKEEGVREFAKFKTTGKPKYQIGGVQLTPEEYDTAKGLIGYPGGGGEVTEAVKQAVSQWVTSPEEMAAQRAELEEAGAFEEVTPGEVSLAAEPQPGEGVPIIGRNIAAVQNILFNAEMKGWIPDLSERDPITGEMAFPSLSTEETLRETSLRQISQNAFDEGVTFSESFGAYIESLPAIGGLVGKYVGGLVEAPYSNTMHALDEINKIKEAASTGQEKVRNGLEDPDYGMDRARSMEEDIAKLEGRIKLLIQTSAILQANTDQVNKIQEQVLEAREKVARYKRASAFGLTAQLTGTGRVIPTDEQMYFELERQNEGKS